MRSKRKVRVSFANNFIPLRILILFSGLFRKSGGVKKQKQIQQHLEAGGCFEKYHNVIDVANLLKTFFRELPEPLIPIAIQDALIRCLIHCNSYEHKVEAILLTILFLPPISINTLAYFLQFLQLFTSYSSENLMTVNNVVKVLTPSIMPLPLNAPEKRLQSHFKVMELLIENANLIGVVPNRMIKTVVPMTEERKKKKRRSGSLNRVLFSGFRKIVGALGGSSESLDKSDDLTIDNNDITMMTPSKSVKKRRRLEKIENSAKKKYN
jgi:Rho GTPase-activating protein 11